MKLYKVILLISISAFGFSAYGSGKLLEAAKVGDTRLVAALIRSGANVNYLDPMNQKTALHYAVAMGHTETIKILIKNKGDTLLRDEDGNTALLIAVLNKRKSIGLNLIKIEVKRGVRPFVLKDAKKVGFEKAIERLWGDLVFVFQNKQ